MLFGVFQCQKSGKNAKIEEAERQPRDIEVTLNNFQTKKIRPSV
jgi:hypothetical protein